MEIKRVAIVGMGALGLLYGEAICKACGRDAVRFVMDSERFARHAQDKYTINGRVQDFVLQPADAAQPVDLVIVATKFSGLEQAMDEMRRLVGEQTVIISVLNGITSEERLIARFGAQHVLYCVALGMDAVREGSSLTYQHQGMLKIGCVDKALEPKLDAVCAFLDRCQLQYVREEDILHALWAKLLLNVGINQTCMVYETNYGGALADEAARTAMFAAMHEVIDVARCEGVSLTEDDFAACVKVISGLAHEGLPSMRQDALAKRPSEVELFAGTILRLAAKHGVPAPANRHYYDKIKAIEAGY